jgi:hypothetical protein
MFDIDANGVADIVALHKRLQGLGLGAVQGDADYDDALLLKGGVELFERGPLPGAVGSPGGPKV